MRKEIHMSPDYETFVRARAAMLTLWGQRCQPADMQCPACMAWALFDSTGRAPDVATVRDALSDAEHFAPRREADVAAMR